MTDERRTRDELLEELRWARNRIRELEERERHYREVLDGREHGNDVRASGDMCGEELTAICAHCKKIRDYKGTWKTPERYFGDLLGFVFSHTICADCFDQLYPNLFDAEP